VEVSFVGNTVVIKTGSREGAPSVIDLEITVPQSMALNLTGTYADITVDGVQGAISAETVNGEIEVHGGKGNVTLHSIQGGVTLADASGRIEVNSVNEDVELSNVTGEIKVETTNGEVTLTGIKSSVSTQARSMGTSPTRAPSPTADRTASAHTTATSGSPCRGANVTSQPPPLTATSTRASRSHDRFAGQASQDIQDRQRARGWSWSRSGRHQDTASARDAGQIDRKHKSTARQ
jgi:hypothetical protein